MSISSLSVKRGVTFGMAYLVLVGFGLFSLARLQLDLFPDISFPMVMVLTNYTRASPGDMETLVTRPLEGAVSGLKGVKEVSSDSKQGISAIMVSFDWGHDMEHAETDVRRSLEFVEGFLPEDAADPMIFAFDPSLQPVVMMMVTGPYPLDELRNIAENDLQPRIERLPGIASIEVAGGLEREIQIVLDPAKVSALGLDVNLVVGAVYAGNVQVPGGNVQQGTLDFTIQTKGKYQSVEEIGEVVVGAKRDPRDPMAAPTPIRLKEVAKVRDSFYEAQRVLEVDGEPTVWMLVRKQSGANTVQAAGAVVDNLEEIKRAAAAEVEFNILFNQADFINKSLGNLSQTAMAGVVITFLVLLLFLWNFRAAIIVATAIPLSVIATFAIMDQAGITLNILSMAGLALAIGMLVDNAIVVLENIFRLMEEGKGPWAASMEGAESVGTAVTASTLTTISVFIPVLFVPGIAGVLFVDMAVTICFSLAVSLIVARTFIPLAASRLLASEKVRQKVLARSDGGFFSWLRGIYMKQLAWFLGHRWVVIAGLAGALLVTGGLTTLLNMDFMREDDQSQLIVQLEAPIGSNLDETYKIFKEVEQRLEQIVPEEERRLLALDVGTGKGFVSLFAKGVHAGMFRLPLVPPGERTRSQQELQEEIRDRLREIPGVKVNTGDFGAAMFGGGGDLEVQIFGHDLELSREVGLELRDKFLALPSVSDALFSMDDQKPEVRVNFDRRKMAELGLSTMQVSNAISANFQGKMAGRYADGGDEFDIMVRFGKEHRLDIDELRKMPVVTPMGSVVPLANIARVDVGLGPVVIARLDQGRVTRVQVSLRDKYTDAEGKAKVKDLRTSIADAEEILAAYTWPKNFSHHIGGAAEDFMDSFQYLGLALLVSILLVYMVMASQFESLRQPFIILFTVPLAAIGVVLMFAITRSILDMASMIGGIMLVGIVVNNGIVMVDAANQLREKGLDRLQAITEAARIRMRPVILTSMTTILAMSPLAIGIGEGSEQWAGMAKAVIGGLIAASAFTLFVVPTMYTFFARKEHRSAEQREAFSAKVAQGEA